jgi:hypothetical protein
MLGRGVRGSLSSSSSSSLSLSSSFEAEGEKGLEVERTYEYG